MPKLEILVYPWVNLVNLETPSVYKYKKHVLSFLEEAKITLWYLGIKEVTDEMIETIYSYGTLLHTQEDHIAARERFKDSSDLSLIPEKYKEGHKYYYKEREINYPEKLDDSHILKRDKEFATKVKQLFNEDVSPALLSDTQLRGTPDIYMLVCEVDVLKDSQLIFAERLRKVGTKVEVDFYENTFHGVLTQDDYKVNEVIRKNIIDYIQKNI